MHFKHLQGVISPAIFAPALFLLLFSLLVAGCSFMNPQPDIPPAPPIVVTTVDQEMAALGFVSYAGELLKGTDDEVGRILTGCLATELDKQPLTKGRYEMLWGPAVYKFDLAMLDDNMLYLVRDMRDSSKVVVVTRGTNGTAILDWLLEDFDVAHTIAWPYGAVPSSLQPRISRATNTGLTVLQGLVPASGVPGSGQAVREFLADLVANQGVKTVAVVGHSLGGALAPTLALWLEDTKAAWDPTDTAQVTVTALAGPTPGNADFAAWYDQRLGKTTRRIHNPLDIVPLAWNISDLKTISGLYASAGIKPTTLEQLAIDAAIVIATNKDYTQQLADAPPLVGAVNTAEDAFLKQVGWQHVCGYGCGLDIQSEMLDISKDCKTFPSNLACTVCP